MSSLWIASYAQFLQLAEYTMYSLFLFPQNIKATLLRKIMKTMWKEKTRDRPCLPVDHLWESWWGTGMPDLPSGEDNSRFGGELTHTIRLLLSKTEPLQSQHHFSSGYQPCTAQLTSPRRLIPACKSRTQARTRKNATQFAEKIKLLKLGSHKPMNGETVQWQINLSKTQP